MKELSRRDALGVAAAGVMAAVGTGAVPRQTPEAIRRRRDVAPPPPTDLVNVLQFEEQARLALDPAIFETIAGGDRDPFERLTLHPRLGLPTLDMDLTVRILGESLYTPILVGPVAQLGRYHAGAEAETIRGAEGSYTLAVVSSQSTLPITEIARTANSPFWFSVYTGEPEAEQRVRAAEAAGAGAIILSSGDGSPQMMAGAASPRAALDWDAVERLRDAATRPVGIKGIRSASEAAAAVERGFPAIVVSSSGAPHSSPADAPMHHLPEIADAVGGRASVLIDGGFRRGTDVLKALILGAQAVLIARPVAWGLSAYGAEGVQVVLQRIQMELARNFGLIGAPNPGELTRSLIRSHGRMTT